MNTGKIINILASAKPVDMGNILWWVCELEEVCAAGRNVGGSRNACLLWY